MSAKNEEKGRNKLKEEFEQFKQENKDFSVEPYLAKAEDLPDLGHIEIYDYDADLTIAK